jgi:hypothetical protein
MGNVESDEPKLHLLAMHNLKQLSYLKFGYPQLRSKDKDWGIENFGKPCEEVK